MNFPCPTNSNCSGTDSPFANLSAEAADQEVFFGLNLGFPWLQPPIGSNWVSNSCLGECVSTVSQADADLCAVRNDLACLLESWGPPGTIDNGGPFSGPPLIAPPHTRAQQFFNQIAQCTVNCPDGNPFTYQVAAGLFSAMSQAAADAMARSYACQLAQINQVCLPDINGDGCVGSGISKNVTILRGIGKFTFNIISGSLPPGTSLTQLNDRSFKIEGTYSSAGNYTFVLRAQNAVGNFMQKTYTFRVLGVTNAGTLPQAGRNQAYSYQFNVSGGVGPYIWQLHSNPTGALPPDGISLDPSTGLYSGTPTTNGHYDFIVTVTDSRGQVCNAACNMNVGTCNTAQSGAGFCPGNPGLTTHIDIPANTRCADTQNVADSLANVDMFNQIAAGLKAQGCACTTTATSDGISVTFLCATNVQFLNAARGLLPAPLNGVLTLGPGTVNFQTDLWGPNIGSTYHGVLWWTFPTTALPDLFTVLP